MSIKQQLEYFYDSNAEHFAQTRKKKRPEYEHIIKYIQQHKKTKLRILELGCGHGRLIKALENSCPERIQHYTGVDISRQLLRKATNTKKFTVDLIHSDMSSYLAKIPQESYDIVISVAAYHHLPTAKERIFVNKNIYKVLSYEGLYIMTNWSRSQWFITKYWKEILITGIKTIITLGYRKRNDVYIPRKTKQQIYHRYYHIFTRKEINYLLQASGFAHTDIIYIDKMGQASHKRKDARNILSISKKWAIHSYTK